MFSRYFLLGVLGFSSALVTANPLRSGWHFVHAVKNPNEVSEGVSSVNTVALSPREGTPLPGFSELTDYILAAPAQEDAGTCLYMSLTGIMEYWTARLNPTRDRSANGDVDLSERFTVNKASTMSHESGVQNWRTDTIRVFNKLGYSVTNRSYPFTKGYFYQRDGGHFEAPASDPTAFFGTLFNWINHVSRFQLEKVELPHFEREVLYADPRRDQWNIGGAPEGLAALIRKKMVERKAPVHVIYNHYGFWHATVIVGFDDQGDSQQCHFVEGFRKFMKENPPELRRKASEESSPDRRNSLLAQARAQETTSGRIEAAWTRGGGCGGKGIFYVRDSMYGSEDEPVYDYNPIYTKGKGNYSKRIISLEYDWVKYLVNHATQIYVE